MAPAHAKRQKKRLRTLASPGTFLGAGIGGIICLLAFFTYAGMVVHSNAWRVQQSVLQKQRDLEVVRKNEQEIRVAQVLAVDPVKLAAQLQMVATDRSIEYFSSLPAGLARK